MAKAEASVEELVGMIERGDFHLLQGRYGYTENRTSQCGVLRSHHG